MALKLVAVQDEVRLRGAYREKEAARYICKGIHTFRFLVHAGKIAARRSGAQRLFLREDLDNYLRQLPVDRSAIKIAPPDQSQEEGGL